MAGPEERSDGYTAGLLDRVRRVLDDQRPGNLKAAARDLGLDYALLQRVVRDGQPPPARLLHALAERYRVDGGWLLAGWGQAADAERGPTVPLVDRLLGFELGQYVPPVGYARVPAAVDGDAAGVYAYRLPPDHPIERVPEWGLRAGDVLLVDSVVGRRLRSILLDPGLVVWRWRDGAAVRTALGDVRPQGEWTDGARWAGRTFTGAVRDAPFELSAWTSASTCPPLPADGGAIGVGHLAGVCFGLVRQFGPADPYPELL